jgi:lysine biosynthesis protein LysW
MKENMASPREQKTYCPECTSSITFKRTPWLGDKVSCRHCGTALEVVDLNPIELDWAFDSEDDDDLADFEYEDEGYVDASDDY